MSVLPLETLIWLEIATGPVCQFLIIHFFLARQQPFTMSVWSTAGTAQTSAVAAENPLTGFNMEYTQQPC